MLYWRMVKYKFYNGTGRKIKVFTTGWDDKYKYSRRDRPVEYVYEFDDGAERVRYIRHLIVFSTKALTTYTINSI